MECTAQNPCAMCRSYGITSGLLLQQRRPDRMFPLPVPSQTESRGLQAQQEVIVSQNTLIKKQAVRIEDMKREIDRLVKRNAELMDACKSASKYLATMPVPGFGSGGASRELDACLEFYRTVMAAKDKLMMTRTKP